MADKVIEDLKQLKHCITKPCDITCSYYNAEDMICPCSYDVSSDVTIDNVIQTIRELQNQIPKWHLCKDELPTENKYVLVVNKDNWVSTEIYCKATEHTWNSGFYIAWMELPKFREVE